MISLVSTVVVAWMSSVGGSPIDATLSTPPMRGVSCACATDTDRTRRETRATKVFIAGVLRAKNGRADDTIRRSAERSRHDAVRRGTAGPPARRLARPLRLR